MIETKLERPPYLHWAAQQFDLGRVLKCLHSNEEEFLGAKRPILYRLNGLDRVAESV